MKIGANVTWSYKTVRWRERWWQADGKMIERKNNPCSLMLDWSLECTLSTSMHTSTPLSSTSPKNNASQRWDGAASAAVATTERCKRVEKRGREGVVEGLAGNRLCCDVIRPSLCSLASVHSFLHIPHLHAVIHQCGGWGEEGVNIWFPPIPSKVFLLFLTPYSTLIL